MLHEVQDVHEQLYAFNNTPIGTLRIGCSNSTGTKCSRRADSKNAERIPRFERQSGYRNSAPDLIADGLDVVIRVGALQDSSLFSRRLGAMPMVVRREKLSHTIRHTGKTRRFE